MCRVPFVRRALVAATASSAILFPIVFTPSAAWAESPEPSACSGLYHGDPPGSLAVTTSPSSATVLHPGDEVEVTGTWDTADWPGAVLHKVLDCLLVNGTVDYPHSSQEKPTDNDGLYRYRFTVPTGVEGRICDRVRLSGRLVDGGDLVVQKSNTVCFSVAGRAGAPGGPADVTTQAATPATDGTPAPLQPVEPAAEMPAPAGDAPATDGTPAPLQPVEPAAEMPAPAGDAPAAPAPAPAPPAIDLSPAVAVHPTLPRTGGDVVPLARLGVILVLLGGAALTARAALSRRPEAQAPLPV